MASDMHNTQPPARRSRFKSVWRVLLAVLLALVIFLFWLLGTASGTRAAFSALPSLTGGNVQAQGVAGRLSDRITMEQLVIDNPGQTITLSDVDLSWRPIALLQRRLHVQQLQVEHLAIVLKEQPEQDDQPARLPDSIRSPVDLQIDRVTLGSGEVNKDAVRLVELNRLDFRLNFDGKQYVLDLERLALQSAQESSEVEAALQGRASLSATRPYPVNARFSSKAQGRVEQQNVGLQGELTLDGSLEDLMARADLAINRLQLQGHVQLHPFSEAMLGEADLAVRALNLKDFGPDLPLTRLDIRLLAQADGEGRLTVNNADAGLLNLDRIPLTSLSLLFHRESQRIRFRDLRAVLGNGHEAGIITGSGQVDGAKADVNLRTERLNLQHLDQRLRATRLSGSATLKHADGRQDIALDLSEPLDRNRITLNARASVSEQVVTIPEAALRIGNGIASFSGSVQLNEEQAFDATGQLQRFKLADLGNFTELPDLLLNGTFGLQGRRTPELQADLHFELKESRLAGHPLQGSGNARLRGNTLNIPALSLLAGANRLQMQGALSEQNSKLSFEINAPQLNQLSPQLAGVLQANGQASGNLDAPRLQLEWHASQLRLPEDIQLGKLQGKADIHLDNKQPFSLRSIVADLHGEVLRMGDQAVNALAAQLEFSPRANAPLQVTVTASKVDLGTVQADTVTLRGDGTTSRHTLQAAASEQRQQWAIQLDGGLNNLASQPRWLGNISQILGKGAVNARLRQPAPLQLSAANTRLENFFVDTDTGSIELERFENNQRGLSTRGHIERLQLGKLLSLFGEEIPLRTDMVLSGNWDLSKNKTLSGTLSFTRDSGDVEILGQTALPLGLRTLVVDANAKGNELVLRMLAEGEKLGHISVNATATGRGRQIEFAPDTRLAGTVKMDVPDIGWAGPLISPSLIASGRLDSQVTIAGTVGQPLLDGALQGNALRLFLPDIGIDLRQGTLLGHFDDSSLQIETLRFAHEDGHIDLSGPIVFGGAQPDVQLALEVRRYQLLNRADRRLTLSGDSRITMQKGEAAVVGQFKVDSGFFDVGQANMPSLSSDVIIVGQEEKQAVPFPLALDVRVALGDGITLTGQGLDAHLVGEVRIVNGADDTLQAQGTLSLAKGTFTAYGRALDIERGVLQFSGPMNNPGLNILAMKRDQEVAAGVSIGGTVLAPRIVLVSEPPLPDADKLSWLVLGRGLDAVAQGDLSVLQAAAGALLSGRESSGTQSRIANAFGLDTLSLTTTGEGLEERIVTVGKQLSSRLYVSYRQGLENLTSVLLLRYQLTRRLTLEAEAGSRSAFSIFYNIAFD